MRCKEKSPPGHPSPIAKNLSKLEGDQVGHIVFSILLSLIQAVLCSAALRIRMSAGHWVSGCKRIPGNEKSPHRSSSIGGSNLHGLRWGISINLSWMCFTQSYYNKVGSRMIQGKKKPANHVGCTQWAGRNQFFPISRIKMGIKYSHLEFSSWVPCLYSSNICSDSFRNITI